MGATLSAGALFRALAPELLMSAGAMVLLLATDWKPQSNNAAMAEGAEKTSAFTRFGVVLCLLVGLVVMIAWGDGANGTPDQRIAGDPRQDRDDRGQLRAVNLQMGGKGAFNPFDVGHGMSLSLAGFRPRPDPKLSLLP